jgi:hypothetical protein
LFIVRVLRRETSMAAFPLPVDAIIAKGVAISVDLDQKICVFPICEPGSGWSLRNAMLD